MIVSWMRDLFREVELTWRLIIDPRVPITYKTVPILTVAYMISPIDIVPELVLPGLGQLDDLALIVLGLKLFVDLCPADIVAEHRRALEGPAKAATWTPAESDTVIDIEPQTPSEEKKG